MAFWRSLGGSFAQRLCRKHLEIHNTGPGDEKQADKPSARFFDCAGPGDRQ